MDLGSPKQLRWAKVGSQGLLVASYLAGNGRMGVVVGGAKRLLWAALAVGAFIVSVAARDMEAVSQAPAAAPHAVDIPFERFTLPNGLRAIVHTDRKAPIGAVHLLYRVGPGDEPAGRTVFAHLLEHLMYRTGHSTFGTAGDLQAAILADVQE